MNDRKSSPFFSKPLMQPFQHRVWDQKIDLDLKITNLKQFILTELYDTFPIDEQHRMSMQLIYMQQYSAVLGQRIDHFVDTGAV